MKPRASIGGLAENHTFNTIFTWPWLLCALFYFAQYGSRAAPGAMMPELASSWGVSALGFSSLLGLYYFAYAGFSIIASVSLDRYGAKSSLPAGITCLAIGAALFSLNTVEAAVAGSLAQGAGSAFAFIGVAHLAERTFYVHRPASLLGTIQMFGMLGAAIGQLAGTSMIHGVITLQHFWLAAGALCTILAFVTWMATPQQPRAVTLGKVSLDDPFSPYKFLLSNKQVCLAGLCTALLFLPTTIGAIAWCVPMLQNGFGIEYSVAINRIAMVPLGWMFGAPLLGYFSDRLRRRKPVLIASSVTLLILAMVLLLLPPGLIPEYSGELLFGFFSGAAMIPYSIVRENNADRIEATNGAMNFLVFSITAVAAPLAGWVLRHRSAAESRNIQDSVALGWYGVLTIAVAVFVASFLKETGSLIHPPPLKTAVMPV